jgi:hypothetical protein
MGAITGKPSPEFITQTLTAYREKGITQFLIYPRSGCELDYLHDEWFATCKHIIEEAERLGFTSIWLYDEFNWPSGTCNRQIPQLDPDYAMKQLCAYRKNRTVEFAVRRNPRMTDLMNPEAVERFIAMTHDQYARHFGRYMGTLIKGFFTDEPDIAFFSYDNEEDILRLPYYTGLEEDYRAATGTDLFADIRSGLANQSDFYQHTCNRLCADKFKTNFAEKISSWCADHDMVLTGHLMNEYASNLALRCNGHPLPVLGAFSLPGMDEIFTHTTIDTIEWLTFGTAMHAIDHQGNNGGLAELFALGPCDLTPAQIRRQLWLAAMFGISKYVMAVAQLDHRANAEKKYYFNPFTRAQPWFQAYDALGEEAKQAASFATRDREYRIEVRYPYTPAPLTDILKHLTDKQYAWRLLAPDDEATCEVVVAPENGGIREERGGQFYFDMQRLQDDLLAKMELRSAWVTDPAGDLVRDTFVRCFQDGACVVVDLSGKTRQLCLNRQGVRSEFSLPAEGVMNFPGWQVELDRPNTLRVDITDGQFVFNLAKPCQNLRIALRNYAGTPELLLDGKALAAESPCTVLPQGFNEVYLSSESLDLAAGKHVIELKNEIEEFPYLPLAWLAGAFSCTRDRTIAPYRRDGCGLVGYAGTISQKAEVTIPLDAQKIAIEPQGLASELKLDGVSLGKRLWAPFVWAIPDNYRGRPVTVELRRYTSCGNVFGELAFEKNRYADAWPWLDRYKPQNDRDLKPFCDLSFS